MQPSGLQLQLLLIATCIALCSSECMNACSGHGKCTVWDMCLCNRNWQSNDCSERTCIFARAWFDAPKGDLDSSGTISGPYDTVAENSPQYPYGTSESYPLMEDSDHNPMTNSGHDYAECANAGLCDRKTGICKCQPGFEGAACQRMSCPTYLSSNDNPIQYHAYEGQCSGHGVCRSLRNIAQKDHGTRYNLWDMDQSTACICDIGYTGGDCHQRQCKRDLDPLYLDDVTTMQYGRYYFPFLTSDSDAAFTSTVASHPATYTIVYFDLFGKPFHTKPLKYEDNCAAIIAALEELPHGIIPPGLTYCQEMTIFELNPLEKREGWKLRRYSRYTGYMSSDPDLVAGVREHVFDVHPTFWLQGFDGTYQTNTTSANNPATAAANNAKSISGKIFSMEFLGNFGERKEPQINIYADMDSRRPTMQVDKGMLFTDVWSDGQRSEGINHWANHCHGVTVSIIIEDGYTYLTGFGLGEKRTLKRCLGGADHDESNNGDSSPIDWDHGSEEFPHMIRLVRTVTDITDSGYYVPLIYDTTVTGKDDSDAIRDPKDLALDPDPLYTDGTFKLLIPFDGNDHIPYISSQTNNVQYEIYTTKGVVQKVGQETEAAFDFASHTVYATNVTQGTLYDGNIACRHDGKGSKYQTQDNANHACLNKGDYFFLLDPYVRDNNPPHINLYKATSVTTDDSPYNRGDYEHNGQRGYAAQFQAGEYLHTLAKYRTNMITTDIATNWAQDVDGAARFYMYKFFPHLESTYEYVAECSNRGMCNYFEGECECFSGYTGDSCNIADTLTL